MLHALGRFYRLFADPDMPDYAYDRPDHHRGFRSKKVWRHHQILTVWYAIREVIGWLIVGFAFTALGVKHGLRLHRYDYISWRDRGVSLIPSAVISGTIWFALPYTRGWPTYVRTLIILGIVAVLVVAGIQLVLHQMQKRDEFLPSS
jgi:hypothetical protein